MEQNAKTITDIDPRVSSLEATESTAGEIRTASSEEPTFFVRADPASHSQFDR